ncbi:hypothetical protein GIB67_032701 [Kingdonia uniflora]|uniref:Apple domain-containing protein n=1 Tax=Kingdonia uniflora TaxID=39325 RepID=A0A7J7MW65_9MAGN|nr:hypothetical protein GIB67_032701 [Kingdonia uniflora]
MIPDMQWPVDSQSLTLHSVKECELACIKNCSCSAYSYNVKCLIWCEGLRNLKELPNGGINARDIYIRVATSELRMANGGFGSVFKGALSYSTQISVKMLEGFRQGEKEFHAEVSTIGRIQRVNLAKPRCTQGWDEYFLTCAAAKLHNGEEILCLVDYKLEDNADIQELNRTYNVACWCMNLR